MVRLSRRRGLILAVIIIGFLYYFGAFFHLFEKDFYSDFHYPYDGDIEQSIQQLRNNMKPDIAPINSYNFKYRYKAFDKCHDINDLRLVYLVKSAPEHYKRRQAIRKSWGYEHRFSDVEIRTIFLIGRQKSEMLQLSIDKESIDYRDLVQANFTDSYYNNTWKTMSGFSWVHEFCPNSQFYMFVDDDYYVSTKNVLRFIRNPTHYPQYLNKIEKNRNLIEYDFEIDAGVRFYGGYGFHSAPHRHMSSKWFVSLEEYPYHMWPPYITAGAYILSREAILDMYHASFYTKHFRFDDIYVGLLAYKSKIEPFHSSLFYFYKSRYSPLGYKYVIVSHGYDQPEELLNVWTEQKSIGHA